mgnify:CR=1 FL=1
MSKSRADIFYIELTYFEFRFIPAFSNEIIENTLESSLIDVKLGSPCPIVFCFSVSLNMLGATRESPPGKNTLSISRKRKTYS